MLKKRFHFFHDNLVIVLTKTTNYYMSYQDFFLKKKDRRKSIRNSKKKHVYAVQRIKKTIADDGHKYFVKFRRKKDFKRLIL